MFPVFFFLGFVGSAVSGIASVARGLFSGKGKEARQARRLERLQARARVRGQEAIIQEAKVTGAPLALKVDADGKVVPAKPGIMEFVQKNWMIIAGVGVAAFVLLPMLKKKK